MPGSPIETPISTQLAVRSLVTQLRSPSTSESDRDHLQQTLNSLLATTALSVQQANQQAAVAIQNQLLALAEHAAPLTESLQCIIDYFGKAPKKLIALISSPNTPISAEQIKQKQLAIATNLLLLIKSGLLSVAEFSCTSPYDPTQPRISALAWSTIFVDDSVSQELASGAVRRYRFFPQYSKQCNTKQLQAYALACPAAEGAHIFSTDIREKFSDADERMFQRPTIAYLCDGFRHAQQNGPAENPWYPLVEQDNKEEKLFLLHLYDTDTDGEHSYMAVSISNQAEDALHFNTLIRELMLEALHSYRNHNSTLSSTALRETLLSLHHQYERHQNNESLKILRRIFHSVLMEYTKQQNNFEYAKFLQELKAVLKRYITEERQLTEEHPETTPAQATTKEAKIHLLFNKLFRSMRQLATEKIADAHSGNMTAHKKIFQQFLKKFLAMLAHLTQKVTAHIPAQLNLTAFFKSKKFTPKKQLRPIDSEFISQIIENQFSKPIKLYLTACIAPLLKTVTKEEAAQLNFLLNEQLMKFVRTSTDNLNYLYAEKALAMDPEVLADDLQTECARLLHTALNFVTAFINKKCEANQTLQAELIQIVSAANEAFTTVSGHVAEPQAQMLLTF